MGGSNIYFRSIVVFNSGEFSRFVSKWLLWKVGRGNHIKFWEDRWLREEESLAEKFPRLYSISLQQHQLISSMGMRQDREWEWNFAWRRALFDSEITSAANFLKDVAQIKIQHQISDKWEWSADPEGHYSTRSAYDLIGEGERDRSQEECFGCGVPK